MDRHGFTLIELLTVMGLLMLFGGGFFIIQRDFFSFGNMLQESLLSQRQIEGVIEDIVSEARASSQSNIGSYPIEIANNFNLAFYSNVDSDALIERVQYFLSGKDLKKSVVKPAGSPYTYATTTAQETLKTALFNVVASTTAPLFSYYNNTYAGTSSPLIQPVQILNIRHIMINIQIDDDLNTLPPPVSVKSEVSIRNLKDNL